MKKYLVLLAVVLAGISWVVFKPSMVGSDSENSNQFTNPQEYNQVGITASASQQGVVKASSGQIMGLEVINDSAKVRYFQIFDMTTVTVPSRAASISGCGEPSCSKIYAASTSWAAPAAVTAKPVSSYQIYASRSLVFSIAVAGATSSTSPGILRVAPDSFLTKSFFKGAVFGISSLFATYSSASVETSKIHVKVLYR